MQTMQGSYIGSRGYTILKSSLSDEELLKIKSELTVVPRTQDGYGPKPESFKNYLESNTKLYLPKYYALQKFGLPEENKLHNGIDIDVKFEGSLRPIQVDAIKSVLDCCNDPMKMGALLCLQCGGGKCLGYDTLIMMFDGTIKKVQDIQVGDLIMGDDSTPRTILSLARGKEMMYEIISNNKESYKVNESHILSLQNIKNEKTDMPVVDYLKLPQSSKSSMFGYRVPLVFQSKEIDFDPYKIGFWLGDGYKNNKKILTDVLFQKALQDNNLYVNKHIPFNYKCNSREIRLQVLAGILDSCGHYVFTRGCYDFKLTNEQLFDDILFLARSLGFECYKTTKTKNRTRDGVTTTTTNYKTCIYGEELNTVPVKILRKKNKNKQIKNNLTSRIIVKKLEEDDYYGFEIDGNHRFVLGDFTVTHNTVCGISMICTLAKKTLIIAHKEFLLEQWKERIQQFAPTARLGLIKAQTLDYKDKDIVLASLQSVSMKNYDDDVFKEFGCILFDEIHRTAAQVFSQAFRTVTCKYSIGLTATPKRKDGLTKVFKWYIGDIAYESKKVRDTVEVRFHRYYNPSPDYSRVHVLYNKKPNISRMINSICEFVPRVEFITDLILDILKEEPNRRFLILSDRRQHVHLIKESLDKYKLDSGICYGGLKQEDLKKSELCQFIIGTFQMVAEGYDVKGLDTLILASPKGDVIQICGRILRDRLEDRKHTPLIIDLIDNFGTFPNQAKKRHTYYKKCKYEIIDKDNMFVEKKKLELPKNTCLIQD